MLGGAASSYIPVPEYNICISVKWAASCYITNYDICISVMWTC